MKISDIKVQIIETGRKYNLTLHGIANVAVGLVRVFTDAGIEGNAEFNTPGFPPRLLAEHILGLKSQFIGQDPFNVEQIWNLTFRSTRFLTSIYPSGCVNVALWDIMGKALSTPLYRLLGGSKQRVRAYASTRTHNDVATFVKEAEALVSRGFTSIKLHAWGDPDRDVELCRVIRKTVGEKIDLMIDPMGLYDRRGALRVGKVLDELNFYWYEEPLPDGDVEGYVELCHSLDVPVLGIDTLRLSLGNFTDYISRGAFDMVQADAARQGITWTKKLAGIAEGFGRRFQGHASGPPLHQAANLHLMGGIPNGDFFEMPIPEGILDTVTRETITLESDGYVAIPQKPGLGLEIDWEEAAKFTKAIIE